LGFGEAAEKHDWEEKGNVFDPFGSGQPEKAAKIEIGLKAWG